MVKTTTNSSSVVAYGFLDATTGQQVRLRNRIVSTEEYGDMDVPELSKDPDGEVFAVRGPEALQIVLEEEPFWLNARDDQPMWGDYAQHFEQLVPVKFRSTKSVTRDQDGRAVNLSLTTMAQQIALPPLPSFLPKGEILFDARPRKGASDDFSAAERYLYMYPLNQIDTLRAFVGRAVRLPGSHYEKAHVHRLKIMGERVAAVLGARLSVITDDPEVHIDRDPSDVAD